MAAGSRAVFGAHIVGSIPTVFITFLLIYLFSSKLYCCVILAVMNAFAVILFHWLLFYSLAKLMI